MDLSKYQKLNTTIDGYVEYRKGQWRYVLFPCITCGQDTLKRKDVYGRQKQCRSCASKTRMQDESLRSRLSDANKTHGQSNSITWKTWQHMRRRIRQGAEHHPTYEGMYIDPRWHDYQNFLDDMGERPSTKHSIDRIDNTKGYYKENCRWATHAKQCRNRSNNRLITFEGKTMCLFDWARERGLTRACLESRLNRGWSMEKALMTPSKRSGN